MADSMPYEPEKNIPQNKNNAMDLTFKNVPINSYEDWENEFKKRHKEDNQWVVGNSEEALARFIMKYDGMISIGYTINEIFKELGIRDNVAFFDHAEIEHASKFDEFKNPRKQDLGVWGETKNVKKLFIGIEAKVNEPFGNTISKALQDAKEYLKNHPNSKAVTRINNLTRDYLGCTPEEVGDLRYQLLYSLAGTACEEADIRFMFPITFITNEYKSDKHEEDYNEFMKKVIGIKQEKVNELYSLPSKNLYSYYTRVALNYD